MSQTIGIDLGTNSLGINLWDKNDSGTLSDQIISSVDVFQNGVSKGTAMTRESSFAAARTQSRSIRRRYRSVKARKQRTLKHLILHGYCPLSLDQLNNWRFDNDAEGYNRIFPTDTRFMQWLALDFDGDGISDYTSAYALRAELMTREFDFTDETERYRLGRAIYHISCHRGFKSSKGERAGEINDDNESDSMENRSETKKSQKLNELMLEHNLETIGQAFYYIERNGIPGKEAYRRVRNSEYTAIRKQYKDEIEHIFRKQNLDMDGDFYKGLISEKKHDGTIFYKRPLKSQKGNLAKCFLEPQKTRCHVSNPEFEEFRALQIINNIRIRSDNDSEWQPLNDGLRQRLMEQKFLGRVTEYFKFKEIRLFIEKELNIVLSKSEGTINYKDETNVSGCPVTVRLNHLFEENKISEYSPEDIRHICVTADDEEWVRNFASDTLKLQENGQKALLTLWRQIPDGYSNLSLKAIRRILPMLRLGMQYSDAVAFAKLPDIISRERFDNIKDSLIDIADAFQNLYSGECEAIRQENSSISAYLQQNPDIDYRKYARKYKEMPNKQDILVSFLRQQFPEVKPWQWNKLYHHSDVEFYPIPPRNKDGNRYLDNPVKNHIMPPSVKHTLFVLRDKINSMIKNGEIVDSEHTRIIVETAREMCDANTKKAIETFNRRRENEYQEFEKLIIELTPIKSPTETDIKTMRLLIDQGERMNDCEDNIGDYYQMKVLTERYKLWKEQDYISIYTGKAIPLAKLFTDEYDVDHTLPISQSFDDSLENKTICEAYYNRKVKRNLLPSQLDIKGTIVLDNWKSRIDRLKQHVDYWEKRARRAADADTHNECVSQKIVYQMELRYWENKYNRFFVTEITDGFRHSQLNDTRIITRYAYHYLKSVFPKVFVERGETTAKFRKILGLEIDYGKHDSKQDATALLEQHKDRTKHYHHAVDALVLSLIPHAKLREEILHIYYAIGEAKRYGNKSEGYKLQEQLYQKLTDAGISIRGVKNAVKMIKAKVIVNHEVKDNKMARNDRRILIRGKATGKWSRGDVAKGQLHKDSFYGAIKMPLKDSNGKPLVHNGRFLYSDVVDGSDIKYVKRRAITGIKNIADIVDPNVRRSIEYQMKNVYNIKNLNSAADKPMWIMRFFKDANGQEQNIICKTDRKGNPLSPIRHVRCYTSAQINSNNIAIKPTERHSKKQCVNLPDRNHKLQVYAEKGEYICCIVYKGLDAKGKLQRGYQFLTDMQLSKDKRENRELASRNKSIITFVKQLPKYQNREIPLFSSSGEIKTVVNMTLEHVLIPGMTMYLKDESRGTLSERTYVIRKCNYRTKGGVLWVSHHAEANVTTDENLTEISPRKFGLWEVVNCQQ